MKSVYYGWIICLLGTLIIFVTMGAVSNGFSIFLPYIMKVNDFSYSQTSTLVTMRCFIAFFAVIGIGSYYNKFSIRVGISIAVACAGVAFFIYSIAENYITFCIGAMISGISYGLGSMVPVTIIVSRWFITHRALVVGICAAGSSMATFFLAPFTTLIIENYSIKTAFWIEGILFIIIAVLSLIFLRNNPAEKGLEAYGKKELHEKIKAEGIRGSVESSEMSRKTWTYMAIVALFMGAIANPSFSHISVLYTTEGYSPMTVATIMSSMGVIVTFGKIIFGQTADSVGGYKASVVFLLILIVGHLGCCLSFTGNTIICMFTVVLLGIGYPIATVGNSVWAGDMASPDKYAEVVRKFQIIYAGGALAFASVPGILADKFGTYIPAYMLFSIMLLVALTAIIFAYKTK